MHTTSYLCTTMLYELGTYAYFASVAAISVYVWSDIYYKLYLTPSIALDAPWSKTKKLQLFVKSKVEEEKQKFMNLKNSSDENASSENNKACKAQLMRWAKEYIKSYYRTKPKASSLKKLQDQGFVYKRFANMYMEHLGVDKQPQQQKEIMDNAEEMKHGWGQSILPQVAQLVNFDDQKSPKMKRKSLSTEDKEMRKEKKEQRQLKKQKRESLDMDAKILLADKNMSELLQEEEVRGETKKNTKNKSRSKRNKSKNKKK